ncbi:MAG TPA: type II secretion system protein GspG [Phycisphaerales bacterium]|nr:type II secretion system protein GspG [Phycisphaerales bacterium]
MTMSKAKSLSVAALIASAAVFSRGAAAAEPVAGADAAAKQVESKKDEGWIRLRQSKSRELRLQVASREFVPRDTGDANEAKGPTIRLVSAVHVADKAFYDELQKELDATDLVLFEGVGPPGLGTNPPKGDAARAVRTKNRLSIVAALIEREKKDHGKVPASLEELEKALANKPTKSKWLAIARKDGWRHELVYTPSPELDSYTLQSYGADGRPGGDGANADIVSDPDELARWKEEGIQKHIADAFGLTFQSDGITTDGPNWRNSDLGMDEVSRRLGGNPDSEAGSEEQSPSILSMLNPDSAMAKIGSGVLSLVKMMPGGADRGKLMMMLILPQSEGLMKGGGAAFGAMGEAFDMARTMKVIVEDRNQKVMDDLAEIVEEAKDRPGKAPKTIAVFYGGGHMPDLEERLCDQLGYRRAGETWHNAVRLDLVKAKIDDEEVRMIGRMMREQFEMLQGMSSAK